MRAKLAWGCLAAALSIGGCSARVERAPAPASANVALAVSPTPGRIRYEPVALQPPAGWVPYRSPNEAGSPVLSCAAFSEREWQVAPDGEGVRISAYRERWVEDPLPFDVRSSRREDGLVGDRRVRRVDDGWLAGFDAGEFGGSLWWFDADGGRRRKLAEDNVMGLADSSAGVLALAGLAHMGMEYGKVLLVGEGQGGDRRVEVVADLGGAPTAFAPESADSLIVSTYERVVRVRTSGEVEQLYAVGGDDRLPYPNSLTLSKAGVIHVGMRHFVLRLSPSEAGYREEWFVPADCNRFRPAGPPCAGLKMCMP